MQPEQTAFRSPDSQPFLVTASTTLLPGSSGGVNSAALKNPTGGPMEILEIRWQLEGVLVAFSLGALVGCKLELGKIPLTNGFVPIWNFNRSDNTFDESPPPDGAVIFAEYCWRLPRPLYVPANSVVVPTFQHFGAVHFPVDVQVTYSCRTVLEKPKQVCLPYAASFVSKAMPVTEDSSDSSRETDIYNPFSEPLKLASFVGRVSVMATAPEPAALIVFESFLPFIGVSLDSGQMMNVRMRDMTGREIIRRGTLFRQAFPTATRAWEMEMGETLPPEAYFLAEIETTAFLPLLPEVTALRQAFIGMTGWREVSL